MELEYDDLEEEEEEEEAAEEEGRGERLHWEERRDQRGLFFVGRLRHYCWRLEVLRGRGTYCAQGK
jgi:hypothetical protein